MARKAAQQGVTERASPAPATSGKAHHAGHRERVRDRLVKGGVGPAADYELLELYLFRSVPLKDTKALAKDLLARYGTLDAVFGAPMPELMAFRGVGDTVALDLKLAQEILVRLKRAEIGRRPVVSSWSALLDYVRVNIQHEPREQFRVLFLDKKNQLLMDEMMHAGTVDHAPVYPREIMRRAMELASSAVILVHNHPSGDPEPSAADITMTHEVVRAGAALGVAVHDHLVVGRHGVVSLAQRGVLQPPPLARGARIA